MHSSSTASTYKWYLSAGSFHGHGASASLAAPLTTARFYFNILIPRSGAYLGPWKRVSASLVHTLHHECWRLGSGGETSTGDPLYSMSPVYPCCFSVTRSCLTLCDPMYCSTPGSSVLHCLPQFVQTHVHRVNDASQPSHPLPSPSPPAFNPSQHQGSNELVLHIRWPK